MRQVMLALISLGLACSGGGGTCKCSAGEVCVYPGPSSTAACLPSCDTTDAGACPGGKSCGCAGSCASCKDCVRACL